jgi:hypothetical protein
MAGQKRSAKKTSTRKKSPTRRKASARKSPSKKRSSKPTSSAAGSGSKRTSKAAVRSSGRKKKPSTKTVKSSATARKPSTKTTAAKKKSTAKAAAAKKKPTAKAAAAKKKPTAKAAAARKKPTAPSATAVRKRPSGTRSHASAVKSAASRRGGVKAARKTVRSGGHKPAVKPPFRAYRGIRPYIFSSYAHKDMETVFKLLRKLDRDRYRLWYDEGIEPGNEWPEVVGNAVIHCTQFMVFMSPAAADSRNVRNEVNLAFTEDKEIIVVYLKKTDLSSGMKLQIGAVQFINRYELSEREFYDKLSAVLNSAARN